MYFDVAEIYLPRWLESSGQRLNNVDRTRKYNKLVLQKNLLTRDLLPQSEFKFLGPENRSKAPLAKNKLWQIPQKRLNKGSKFDFFSPQKS